MMNAFNAATIVFLVAAWVISLAVAIFEIKRILGKNSKIEEERLRKTKGGNLESDLFGGANTAHSVSGGGEHKPDQDHSLHDNALFEEARSNQTAMLEPDERDAELFHRLVFSQIGGEPSERVRILNKRENYLGRDKDFCNICVDDSFVSSRQAVIICDGESMIARNDEAPKNPTYIDGRPLCDDESVELDEGAEVRMGKTVFKAYHRKKVDMKRDAPSEN